IFKLSDTSGNLVESNRIPAPKQAIIDPTGAGSSGVSGKSKSQIGIIAGGVGGGVVLALLIGFFVVGASRRRRQSKDSNESDGNSHPAGSANTNTTSNLCRHFSFAEIKAATNNFDEALLLGVGGFGK
ncbi:hypothetical protein CRG98_049641, partial [Punica granatum]